MDSIILRSDIYSYSSFVGDETSSAVVPSVTVEALLRAAESWLCPGRGHPGGILRDQTLGMPYYPGGPPPAPAVQTGLLALSH